VVPLRSGQHFQTVMGPAAPYWPRLSSMRKRGIPVKKSMMKYGMRNTPATQHRITVNVLFHKLITAQTVEHGASNAKVIGSIPGKVEN